MKKMMAKDKFSMLELEMETKFPTGKDNKYRNIKYIITIEKNEPLRSTSRSTILAINPKRKMKANVVMTPKFRTIVARSGVHIAPQSIDLPQIKAAVSNPKYAAAPGNNTAIKD